MPPISRRRPRISSVFAMPCCTMVPIEHRTKILLYYNHFTFLHTVQNKIFIFTKYKNVKFIENEICTASSCFFNGLCSEIEVNLNEINCLINTQNSKRSYKCRWRAAGAVLRASSRRRHVSDRRRHLDRVWHSRLSLQRRRPLRSQESQAHFAPRIFEVKITSPAVLGA